MRKRIKLLMATIAISSIIVLLSSNIINAVVDDLNSKLKGKGKNAIGTAYKLSYTNSLKGNTGLYCIQKDKKFKGENTYVVKSYVEINGKQANVYTSSDGDAKQVKSDLNAEVAYILNQGEGYGTHENPTDTQIALWNVTNEWTKTIFGDNTYGWDKNTGTANAINKAAKEYAANVGDMTATDNSTNNTATASNIVDKTNKNNISVLYVDGYYRVGPFRWEFDGKLNGIEVTGDNGKISESNVRIARYRGSVPSIIDASDLGSGEDFYIDVKASIGIKKITGLTLKSGKDATSNVVYTAKVWFLQSKDTQNVIYADVGNSKGKPEDGKGTYDISLTLKVGITKVDDRDTSKPLKNVGFKFKANVYRYVIVGFHYEWVDKDGDNVVDTQIKVDDYEWRWVEKYLDSSLNWEADSNGAKIFYTNENGVITVGDISGETTQSLKAVEVSNPYYGYSVGTEYSVNTVHDNTKITNHQKLVKLSGYVWLDINDGKTTQNNEMLDDGENGINGIKVYLKNSSGIVKTTTTSELGIYSEINGGEYQFVDVDLDEVQKGSYYIEFEYCGITYQSVAANLNENRGSKAIDTETRNALDSKFTSVEGNGTQNLSINGVTANYKDTSNHVSSLDSHIDKNYNYRYDASNTHTGCDVYARTNEAGYNMYANFTPVTEEIRYINLGLHEKAQTDYALTQDLYNVRAEINGFSHIYRYGKVRYSNNGNTIDENSSWNLGVKFQNNKGTYSRAIYNSDVNYINSKNKDRELKVYVTYKIALKNESSYLGRINNIVNYSDIRYDLIAAGTSINDKDEISGNKTYSKKTKYNDEYSKYTIDVNTVLKPGETKYIYVQFEMQREAILAIVNNKNELLNNVAEINSYTTFKDNNTNTPVAVLDKDSVPGNTKPGNVDTYEDDTDAARSLKLELKNARVIEGTVFVDNPEGIDINSVNTGKERKGNGIFDNGEKTISGIKVTLKENEESESGITPVTTETDENGNFKFEGYVPGKYVLTYTWGDKEYKVQYYKGTIYDESRKQDDKYWYRGSEYNNDTISVNARKTDALDSREIRDQIDNEMENLKINTLESEIEKAYNGGSSYITKTQMDSTTPEMYFSVEYETTITDGTDDKIEFKVKNVDFGIIERARQLLEFNKRVSAFKITLANGQVLADATIDENGKLHGSHQYTTYMGPTNSNNIATSGTVKIEMDTEIIEGATVEITYEMKVTNIGEVDYVSDRYYYYGNSKGSDKVRVSVTGLIDYVDNQLSVLDDKWEQKDTTTLEEYNARQKDNEAYINTINTYFTTKLSKNLAPTESNTVTLTTSKLLTSTKDIEFNNQAEIAEITKPNTFNSGSPAKVVWNGDKGSFQYDNAEKFIIVPSTGSNKNYTLPIVIGIISVLTLGLGAFGIKKFVIGK